MSLNKCKVRNKSFYLTALNELLLVITKSGFLAIFLWTTLTLAKKRVQVLQSFGWFNQLTIKWIVFYKVFRDFLILSLRHTVDVTIAVPPFEMDGVTTSLSCRFGIFL